MGFRLPEMGDWLMPTATPDEGAATSQTPRFSGSYLDWRNAQGDQSAINPMDYLSATDNPNLYFERGKTYTADQIGQMTGSPVNDFSTYQGINVATAANPFADPEAQGYNAVNTFVKNPNGTYTSYPVGTLGGIRPNAPESGSWTDYMDTAITLASALGAGYAGAGAIGAAFAPEAAALGSTGAGSIDAYMAGAGLDAGSFGGSAFTMPELAAEAIPFELPDGTMGSIQNGNIVDASGNVVAKGGVDLTAGEVLKYANQARQGLGIASALSKLVGGSSSGGVTGGAGGTATGTTGGLSPKDLAKYLYSAAPAQAGAVPYQIKMNQNPFTFDIPGQTKATEGMYDVSGVNPMANALRKNNGTNS